jgi:hypothetical protein
MATQFLNIKIHNINYVAETIWLICFHFFTHVYLSEINPNHKRFSIQEIQFYFKLMIARKKMSLTAY